MKECQEFQKESKKRTHSHTHIHTHIYIYKHIKSIKNIRKYKKTIEQMLCGSGVDIPPQLLTNRERGWQGVVLGGC